MYRVRSLIALACILMLAVACSSPSEPTPLPPSPTADATATPEPTATPTPSPVEPLLRIAANVADLREVTPDEDIHFELASTEELLDAKTGQFKRVAVGLELPEREQLYKALRLMDEDQDLEELLLERELERPYAVYDQDRGVVLVATGDLGPEGELAVAEAYMAAIQQSLFDVAQIRTVASAINSDQRRAVDAFIRGDISLATSGYVSVHFSEAQYEEVLASLVEEESADLPKVVLKTALLPHWEGAGLASALFEADGRGWAGVTVGYSTPPVSTEQVMHPEKYFNGDTPLPPAMPDFGPGLGEGWTHLTTDVMGEFILRTYLEEHLHERDAAKAAEGWGSDSYALFEGPGGQRLLVAFINWDSPDDTEEFLDAHRMLMEARFEGAQGQAVGEVGLKWVTPEHTVLMDRIVATVLLVLGDTEDAVDTAAELASEALAK